MSLFSPHRHAVPLRSTIIVAVVVVGSVVAGQIHAQQFIFSSPTSNPTSGHTATPLTTAPVDQHKLGSLLIGQAAPAVPAELCLNASNFADSANCVTSWGGTGGVLNGFVRVETANPAVTTPPLNGYDTPQSGYASLIGNSSSGATTPTFSTAVNQSFGGAASALYATTTRQEDYAGYFAGKLAIEPTAAGPGRLCLNGTDNIKNPGQPDNPNGHCIFAWSDIPNGTVTDYLKLQNAISPVTETGAVALQQSFGAGAAVIGAPNASIPAGLTKPYCGDDLCSADIGENVSGVCEIDCYPLPLPNVTQAIGTVSGVSITVIMNRVASGVAIGNQAYDLVVRSNVQDFKFEPVDGVSYATGPAANYVIVRAQPTLQNSTEVFTDNFPGLVNGTRYYYRAYEGNAYPRYVKKPAGQLNYVTFSAVSGATTAPLVTTPSQDQNGGAIDIPQ